MMKKIGSILILIIILMSAISCGDNSKITSETTTGQKNETTSLEETAELSNEDLLANVLSSLSDETYDGYSFIIVDRSAEHNANWYTRDVFTEELNGEPLNDAVYQRNTILEDKYDIKIVEHNSSESPSTIVKRSVLANEDAYDVVTDGINTLATLASEDLLVDYYGIPNIDLTNDWWDQNMPKDLSVANKIFYSTGDISTMDNHGTWCILFIKDLISDYQLDDPYALVNDGKWTLDKMNEMCSKVYADLNGDGVMTIDEDAFGVITEGFNTYALWVASGEKIITKDENDLPISTMFNERSTSVVDKVLNLQFAEYTIDNTTVAYYNAMSDGRTLFRIGGMKSIVDARPLVEREFGVIPLPKYDEQQDKHYSTYSYTNLTAYSVPKTSSDLTRTGIILEAMSVISKYILTPAYYDITLMGKAIRDNESEEMIKLILDNRNYDLGSMFNWGGSFSVFTGMYSAKSYDFASRYAAAESAIDTAIHNYVELIK